jgi:hypothetical protein
MVGNATSLVEAHHNDIVAAPRQFAKRMGRQRASLVRWFPSGCGGKESQWNNNRSHTGTKFYIVALAPQLGALIAMRHTAIGEGSMPLIEPERISSDLTPISRQHLTMPGPSSKHLEARLRERAMHPRRALCLPSELSRRRRRARETLLG